MTASSLRGWLGRAHPAGNRRGRRTRSLMGASCAAAVAPAAAAAQNAQAKRKFLAATRGENNSGAKCYVPNFISHWRFYDTV